jgi:hypothetical protein
LIKQSDFSDFSTTRDANVWHVFQQRIDCVNNATKNGRRIDKHKTCDSMDADERLQRLCQLFTLPQGDIDQLAVDAPSNL